MEQQDTHIPYRDRTLVELCQDINFRAEQVYLKLNHVVLVCAAVLLVFVALIWYYQWFEINWYVYGAFVVWVFVYYLVNKLLINSMKRASNVKQHLRRAKCLKWWDKLSRAMMAVMVFFSPLSDLVPEHKFGTILMIVGPLLLLFYIITPVDEDFNDGLAELEYRLEE